MIDRSIDRSIRLLPLLVVLFGMEEDGMYMMMIVFGLWTTQHIYVMGKGGSYVWDDVSDPIYLIHQSESWSQFLERRMK